MGDPSIDPKNLILEKTHSDRKRKTIGYQSEDLRSYIELRKVFEEQNIKSLELSRTALDLSAAIEKTLTELQKVIDNLERKEADDQSE